MGHDEKDHGAYQLMQEKTIDTYLMKNDESMQTKQALAQYPKPRGVSFLGVEAEEEDLVAKKAKLYLIIVENLEIFLEVTLILSLNILTWWKDQVYQVTSLRIH